MFEHMRNYRELLSRVAGWLKDDGRLFVALSPIRYQPQIITFLGVNPTPLSRRSRSGKDLLSLLNWVILTI